MFAIQKTYLHCFDLEQTVDFYRTLLKRDGTWLGRNECAFDLDGTWLSCVRQGGHEQVLRPNAVVISTTRLPTVREIEHAGGRAQAHFSFAVPDGETVFATDPAGNQVCFVVMAGPH